MPSSLDGGIHKGKVADGVESVEPEQKDGHTDNVSTGTMAARRAFLFAPTEDSAADTGADVLTHDDGDMLL